MALSGTLVKSITIKSDGDVFHEIFRDRPHHISEMSPECIKGVDLHDGEWGKVGSVIQWDFFHDGKAKVAKEVIEAIDEEKRSVCFKVIGGDILDAYKNFLITVHVDTHGEENLVTWTFHYEKINENIPEPDTLMDFVLSVTKDIETHHLPKNLSGTLVKSITIKSDGDVFHEIFRDRPHHISDMSPECIKGVDLHDGEWGKVGSVIQWDFFHDGKAKVAKEVIEAIDEEKRSVCFKVIGGDILEAYKTFLITVHVDTHGEENLVTWTFHYEKINENIPEPDTLMDFVLSVTKDIESHHLPKNLSGTLVKSITIKSDGDVFHEIFRDRPHHISDMSPGCIKGVDLHDGEWGTVGSVINWNFIHEGKEKVAKEVIEAIDEEKRSVCFKVIGGDILEAYKNFLITVHVDTHGEENLVTWTFHYEKVNENIPEPDSLMDFVLSVTKDIEAHHLPKSE